MRRLQCNFGGLQRNVEHLTEGNPFMGNYGWFVLLLQKGTFLGNYGRLLPGASLGSYQFSLQLTEARGRFPGKAKETSFICPKLLPAHFGDSVDLEVISTPVVPDECEARIRKPLLVTFWVHPVWRRTPPMTRTGLLSWASLYQSSNADIRASEVQRPRSSTSMVAGRVGAHRSKGKKRSGLGKTNRSLAEGTAPPFFTSCSEERS